MLTFALFCKMKISRSSRITAKQPMATHSPLVLVRLILSGGADGAVACWGAVCGGDCVTGPVWGGTPAPVAGPGAGAAVGGDCGSVVI